MNTFSIRCFSDVNFWRKKKDQGIRYPGNTDFNVAATTEIVRYAQEFLSEIYNISTDDMEEPSHAVIGLWDSYPYGAGWYHWKPGYNWKEVCSSGIRIYVQGRSVRFCSVCLPGYTALLLKYDS